MKLRIGRIIAAAIVIEVLSVLILVALVAAFGPPEKAAAQAFAERLGAWVGPLAGFFLCLAGGFWVARRVAAPVLNGFVLGLVVAGIDISLLVVAAVSFQPIFAISNIGRIIAGTTGGWLATRRFKYELAPPSL